MTVLQVVPGALWAGMERQVVALCRGLKEEGCEVHAALWHDRETAAALRELPIPTLTLPAGGVTVEKAELPDLPATKVLVMRDAKRTLRVLPYSHWVEKSFEVGSVVIDKKVLRITIEK